MVDVDFLMQERLKTAELSPSHSLAEQQRTRPDHDHDLENWAEDRGGSVSSDGRRVEWMDKLSRNILLVVGQSVYGNSEGGCDDY
jgi:hypothetical protein